MNKTTSKRLLALDILRGITIAGMIMVNNPGTWAHIYAPLRHAEWNGLTPIGTRPMERFDTDRSRIPLFHVYHGNIYLYFSPEIQF
jgi:hypothetical protein